MVTIDPDRDTPVLADYVSSFVEGGHALATDDAAELRAAADPFGVSYLVEIERRRRDRGRPLPAALRRRRRRPARTDLAVRRPRRRPRRRSRTAPRERMIGPGRRLARLVPRVITRRHTIGVFVAVVAGAVVASPSAAIADSARPTDFRSEVVAIDPPTPSIAVSIVGGDAFVLLRVDPGVEVEVMGYQSEPYLRFAADGTVYENQRSPATYINGSRYGGGSIPEGASAAAEPDWAEVAPAGQRRVRLARPPLPPDAAGRAGRRTTGRPGLHRCGADRRRRGRGERPDREHVDARPVAMAGGARCGVRRDRDRGGLRWRRRGEYGGRSSSAWARSRR